jgi:hypothetical protein
MTRQSAVMLAWANSVGETRYIPCRLTGRLDRTVTGRLQPGNSVEVVFSDDATMRCSKLWVMPGDLRDSQAGHLTHEAILIRCESIAPALFV